MRTTDFVRLLLMEMLAVLVVHHAWSSEVWLDKTCVEQNGTVCNRRPPKECNLERPQPSPARQRLSVNPETLFNVAVFVNRSTPSHLRLEWIQDYNNLSHPTTVRITPLLQGRILEDRAICLSSLGSDNETHPQIHWSDSARNGSRHITMVPITDKMTTSIVEINTNSGTSQYIVQTPRFSRHSWILPGIAITAHNNKGYISITPKDIPWNAWSDTPRVIYTVTLVCHVYNNTGRNQTVDKLPMTILSRSPVTNCSSTKREMYIPYLRRSHRPIVIDMARLAYSVVIDAQMVTGSSNQVIAETDVTTPIFAYVGTTSEVDILVSPGPELEVSMAQTFNIVNKLSATKSSATPSVMAVIAGDHVQSQPSVSGRNTFPSKNDETVTRESETIIVVAVVLPASALIAVVFVFIAWRARKYRTSTQQEEGRSDKPKVYEGSKITTRNPMRAIEGDGPSAAGSRMPRFRSQCCTNRFSDVATSGDSSDPLISNSTVPGTLPNLIHNLKDLQLTDHDILDSKNSCCDDSSRHVASRRSYLQSKDDAFQGRYDYLPHGPISREPKPTELDEALNDIDGSANTQLQCITHPPLNTNRNLPHVADFKIGSDLVLNSVEDRIYKGDYYEDDFGQEFHAIQPPLVSDNIDPMIMRAECLKINQEYETLNAIVTDSHNYPSSESSFEDECFSISESIAW